MVYLTALWLPILISAVIVFIASSILHMLLTYHRSDYKKLPNEENLLEAMRKEGVSPGNYSFPCPASPKDMSSPEMIEKYKKGPVGIVHVLPSGPPVMAKHLTLWFIYCLVVGVFVAYLAGRTLGAGTDYLAVFRVSGTAAFLGYGIGNAVDSIWMGQSWSTSIKHVFDGLVYALLTAGVFGWLWP
jgi:hypothetical protein